MNINTFLENFASVSGGAIMLADKIPTNLLSENKFLKNSANYFGQDYASNPYRILFLSNQPFGIGIIIISQS